MNEKVKAYIAKQTLKNQKIIKAIRKLLMEVFPGISEGYMWGVPIYDEGRFYIAALKKQVNLGVSIIGLSEEEVERFEGKGKTARHIKVYCASELESDELIENLKMVKKKAGIPK